MIELRRRSEPNIKQIIGDLGEVYAADALRNQGYLLCRADRIGSVGHSLLGRESLQEWDCGGLRILAKMCRESFECDVDGTPCQNSSRFYEFNPEPSDYFMDTADEDGRFKVHCAYKMSYLAILDECASLCDTRICPIKSYLTINNYIHSLYDVHASIGIIPTVQRTAQMQLPGLSGFVKPDSEIEQDGSSYAERRRFWRGHPGRIDLFGFKDGEHCCLEVKVNSARLNKWQIIRLNWMREQGIAALVVRVRLGDVLPDLLTSLYHQDRIMDAIELFKPSLELEEFRLSDYGGHRALVPDDNEVKYYNGRRYRWIRIQPRCI